jgi:hypothetical protein
MSNELQVPGNLVNTTRNTEILDERISNQTLTYLGHVTPCSTCMVHNSDKTRSGICSLNTSRRAFLMGRPRPPEDEYYSSLLEGERIAEEEAV